MPISILNDYVVLRQIANVIFIDSPRGVGFSFQNMTENKNREYSDSAVSDASVLK